MLFILGGIVGFAAAPKGKRLLYTAGGFAAGYAAEWALTVATLAALPPQSQSQPLPGDPQVPPILGAHCYACR